MTNSIAPRACALVWVLVLYVDVAHAQSDPQSTRGQPAQSRQDPAKLEQRPQRSRIYEWPRRDATSTSDDADANGQPAASPAASASSGSDSQSKTEPQSAVQQDQLRKTSQPHRENQTVVPDGPLYPRRLLSSVEARRSPALNFRPNQRIRNAAEFRGNADASGPRDTVAGSLQGGFRSSTHFFQRR